MDLILEGTVELFDADGVLIEKVNEQIASKKVKNIMRQNDHMKALLGDGNARVTVGVDEAMGGPYGYSSVKVRVSVTLSCDQNAESVTKAQQICFDQCTNFVEDNISVAHTMLCAHLKANYVKEA